MKFLGVDIGGTRLKVGLVDERGRLSIQKAVRTPTNLKQFKRVLREKVAEVVKDEELIGVGVGCKGIIGPRTTTVEVLPGEFRFLEGQQLAKLIEVGLPRRVPIYADNDARVALAGELVWGAARRRKNVLMLTLGTGIGGAALCEGKLVRGKNGVAGHLGHITIDPDGPVCVCGNRGCLETFFSAKAIEAEALAAIHRGCESDLTTRFQNNREKLTCEAIFQLAAHGDSVACAIRDRAIRYLGAGLAGLVHAFDPEIVILGGQISEAGNTLFKVVKREVWERTSRLVGRKVPIVPQRVSDRSGIVGAAALVLAHDKSLR